MGYERELSARQKALRLVLKRDAIEAELHILYSLLTKPGGPGMSGNLVDSEGFPRADIDIPSVRSQRNRHAVLSTDLKEVIADIEKNLHIALAPPETADDSDMHPQATGKAESATGQPTASASAAGSTTSPPEDAITENSPRADTLLAEPRRRAFALVDMVTEGSPAATAGLEVNDRIVAFGAVSLQNFPIPRQTLGALPGLLREHENREIEVTLERGEGDTPAVFNLGLTPRRWAGEGLLGCHVVPLDVSQVDWRYRPDVATAVMSHGRADRV